VKKKENQTTTTRKELTEIYQSAAPDEHTQGGSGGSGWHRGKKKKFPELQKDVTSRAIGRKRNDDTPLGYSGRTALRREQCDEMAESRNSGIGSEVDFLGNELLRQLHDN
jgi:hypothetical protein